MASTRDDLRARVEQLLREVGELAAELTIVGGTAPALYSEMDETVAVRPTDDIDVVVKARGHAQWHRVVAKLEEKGFRWAGGDAPVTRYVKGELLIDVMPTDDSLGFGNRWYDEAVARRMATSFGVHVAAPIYFIATKLVALRDPERTASLYSSHDLEDIIAVLRGIPRLLDELRVGSGGVHDFVRTELVEIMSSRDALDLIRGHLEGDAGTQALAPSILAAIRALAEMSGT